MLRRLIQKPPQPRPVAPAVPVMDPTLTTLEDCRKSGRCVRCSGSFDPAHNMVFNPAKRTARVSAHCPSCRESILKGLRQHA